MCKLTPSSGWIRTRILEANSYPFHISICLSVASHGHSFSLLKHHTVVEITDETEVFCLNRREEKTQAEKTQVEKARKSQSHRSYNSQERDVKIVRRIKGLIKNEKGGISKSALC